ncbi:MAG: histidinol-phosphate transaminase [Planctomycetes bacterium]|nr:histidinol-phosphate transaminase [Planctomycetota bacterium]
MSYFRKIIDDMDGYVPGFQPVGTDVVKLNTNENPYPPSPQAVEAIRNFDTTALKRYPQPLADSFCKAAADVLDVEPDNILCTNGGDDLLTICFRSFCDENRHAAFPGPTYSLYPVLAKLQNCKTEEIPFAEDYSLPADKLVESGAAMVIVCNPNAPSGSFIDIAEIKKLADRLKDKSILLVDEAYIDFAESNCVSLIKECGNVIILRSMSKGYSLAGLRFGYAIAPKEIIAGMRKVKDSYNVDAIAIAAATAAIWDQGYFRENAEKVKAQRSLLTAALREMGFQVLDSQSNFILARCINSDASKVYDALAAQNIYVRYFKLAGLDDKLRISIGTKEQNEKLIQALKKIL